MIKNICIVHGNDLSEPNAGSNRVIALAKILHENRFNITLVIPRPKYTLPNELKGIRIAIVPISVGGTFNKIARAFYLIYTTKKIAKSTNSVIQIYLSTLGGFAALLGLSGYVLEMNDLAFESPVYTSLPFGQLIKKIIYEIEKMSVKNAKHIIVISNPLKEYLINEWKISKDIITVIPNGFNDNIALPDIINEYFEGKYIVRTGSLFKHINLESLISLSRSLSDEDIKILLIGDGPLRKDIENYIVKEHLKNIIITGWLPYDKAMALTYKAEVAFMTGKRSLTTEMSCPVKILDYAALGKAMAISDCSELSKKFGDNYAALVSDPDHPEDFINNVHRILKDDKLRVTLAINAKKLSEEFKWDNQGEKLLSIYSELN